MSIFWIILICAVGLCMGSFYNVVILRSLSNESIVFPASKCPKCNHRLLWWQNIPVISYIILRGRCYFCKEKISIQYPIVELLTMGLFLWSYLRFGMTIEWLFFIIVSSGLLIMAGTDIKEKIVDCNIALGIGLVGIIYNFIKGDALGALLGLLAGILIFEALAWGGKLLVKKRAFGEADTFVAGALGACFGFNGLMYVLGYTTMAAMLFIAPVYLYRQFEKGNKSVCILAILFIIALLIFKAVSENKWTLLLLLVTAITFALEVLKHVDSEDRLSYFPLVPAFAAGALYYLSL